MFITCKMQLIRLCARIGGNYVYISKKLLAVTQLDSLLFVWDGEFVISWVFILEKMQKVYRH